MLLPLRVGNEEKTVSEPMEANPDLVIGWAVTKGLDPQYWLAPQSSAGGHSLNDLVRVPAASMANHMVIVAQSGSGKSFFLGRVVEEIVIKTKSRVFIFDPNSDFRKIDQIVSADLWKERARYDAIQRRGFLPDEETRENFENKWKKVDKLVFSVRPDDSNTHKKLQIDWFGVSVDFLAEDVDPTLQNELRHCHDFVKSIAQLVAFTKSQAAAGKEDILDLSRRLCEETRGKTRNDIVFVLKDRLPLPDELKN
jgi:hypothetical protein